MSLFEPFRQKGPGPLPALLALVVIAVVFQSLNANFLSPRNLTNLCLQIAAMATVSCGVVWVLLLGEIDLSAGAVSGLCAAVMAVLCERMGLPGAVSVAAAVAAGVAVGLFHGAWLTRFGVPSFVVTLAGLLAWQGVHLQVLGTTGSINLTDPFIVGLCSVFLPLPWAASLGAVAAALAVALSMRERASRSAAGLSAKTDWPGLATAVAGGALALAVLSADRGAPLALLLVLALIALTDLTLRRTRFGRHVLAVGGNAEAARRAGIRVERVRLAVFALSSALAACGGVLAGSRLLAVNQSSGGGGLLLDAIAAAVIGGTSLFGGRGSAWSALFGALVIGAISNGMDLLALASPVKLMVTGAVLLAAVTADAFSRTRRLAR